MVDKTPRLLILGAHPDDADFGAGALVVRYRRLGYPVKMISVTSGAAGHHRVSGPELATIRAAEARAAGEMVDAVYEVWEFPDGRLQPTLEVRERIIREVRRFNPDLVVTHRPFDYHPDHRAVGQAVQDASFLFTVPAIAPDVPALRRDPIVAYIRDGFTKPAPIEPHVLIDGSAEVDTVVRMLACHRSQVFEWLAFHDGIEADVPQGETERLAWLRSRLLARGQRYLDRFRPEMERAFGVEQANLVKHLEVFEISEYAAQLDEAARRRLFPPA